MRESTSNSSYTRYYTVLHPSEFKLNWAEFYKKAARLTTLTRNALPHYLDIPYGKNPEQGIDIYLPEENCVNCPVFFFLHGGGFREGDRSYYGYISRAFAGHGIMTVVAGYRLSPESCYPDQAIDVQRALSWLFNNINDYGGNPENITVGGHSAGAILAAFVSFKRDWLSSFSLPLNLIKACALVSGRYDLRKTRFDEYLPDSGLRAEASPLLNIGKAPPKTVVAFGSVDPPEEYMDAPSNQMIEKLQENLADVKKVFLKGMNHADTAFAIGDEHSRIFQTLLQMIRSNTKER